MDFWDFFWLLVWGFLFITYLMVLFQVVIDVFRDSELTGWARALWIVALIFLPLLTTLVYVVVRGRGMSRRQAEAAKRRTDEAEAYVRSVAQTSPADQIATAKSLLDSGAITPEEFAELKSKALS